MFGLRFTRKRATTPQIRVGANGCHAPRMPFWRRIVPSVALAFGMLRRAERHRKPIGRRTAAPIGSLTVCAICLFTMTGQPAKVIAAESNLEHKMSPLTNASSKPEFGLGSGSFIVAPIPFSDPMIDSGLALGAGYLFKVDDGSDPSLLGIGYLRSQNGSEATASHSI